MNDILTPEMQYERDVRLYGVTVARLAEGAKEFGFVRAAVGRVTKRSTRTKADRSPGGQTL